MSYACASKRTKRLGRAEGRPRSRSPLLGPARAIVFSQGPLTPGCSEDLLSTGVTKSYRVTFDRNRYSVPSRLVGQGVLVRGTDDSVSVFLGPKQVASHRRCWGIGEDIHHESHDEGVLAQKPRAAAGQLPPGLTGLGQVGARYLKVFAAGNRSIQREVARLTLLAELFGEQATAAAMEDVMATGHVGAEYVEYVMRHRKRLKAAPAPLRLGRPDLDGLAFREPEAQMAAPARHGRPASRRAREGGQGKPFRPSGHRPSL